MLIGENFTHDFFLPLWYFLSINKMSLNGKDTNFYHEKMREKCSFLGFWEKVVLEIFYITHLFYVACDLKYVSLGLSENGKCSEMNFLWKIIC